MDVGALLRTWASTSHEIPALLYMRFEFLLKSFAPEKWPRERTGWCRSYLIRKHPPSLSLARGRTRVLSSTSTVPKSSVSWIFPAHLSYVTVATVGQRDRKRRMQECRVAVRRLIFSDIITRVLRGPRRSLIDNTTVSGDEKRRVKATSSQECKIFINIRSASPRPDRAERRSAYTPRAHFLAFEETHSRAF